uniref:hypothetical protein n=1 Tax=Ningiella ruwaisensis TaxID=2364274 RepID=UPI00109F18E6|nr:hypothetical protein [Ningiella ruwaisensis]
MRSIIKTTAVRSTSLVICTFLLASCVIHVGASDAYSKNEQGEGRSYSATNKSVRIDEGLSVSDVSSVNGSVTLESGVQADEVSSVNGKVTIGDRVNVDSVEVVNGRITIGSDFLSEDSVESVNGRISIEENSRVGKNIETVNGDIELEGVTVGRDIITVNGDILLSDGSVVEGDIRFEGKPNNNSYRSKPPVLRIDASSTVKGQIIIYKEVEFDFADEELASKVVRK